MSNRSSKPTHDGALQKIPDIVPLLPLPAAVRIVFPSSELPLQFILENDENLQEFIKVMTRIPFAIVASERHNNPYFEIAVIGAIKGVE